MRRGGTSPPKPGANFFFALLPYIPLLCLCLRPTYKPMRAPGSDKGIEACQLLLKPEVETSYSKHHSTIPVTEVV